MTVDETATAGIAHGRAPEPVSVARIRAAVEQGIMGRLAHDATDIVYVLDDHGRIRYVNDATERALGYAPDALLGRKGASVVHPEDRSRAIAKLCSAWELPGYRGRIEVRLRHLGGEWRSYEVSGQTVVRDDGETLLVGQARSVTLARAAERALRESEARFRLMVEGSEAVFFYEHDPNHRFTYLSPSIRQVLGYSPAELLGKPYDVLLARDPVNEDVEARTDVALATGVQGTAYEARVLNKSGELVVVELVERPLIEEGEVVGMQGFARDVTERHRSQEALRESQERYRALVEQSPDAIAVHVDGDLVYANRTAAELAGVGDPNELIGRSVFELLDPSLRRDVERLGRRMLARGEEQARMDMVFPLPDGTEKHGEVSATLLTWEGAPAVQVVVRDMTDRKRAELALRQSEERFRSLIESSADLVAVLDSDGVIRYHSPSATVLGYESRELQGRQVIELVHPDEASEVGPALEALVGGASEVGPVEVRLRHRDGTWRILQVVATNRLRDPAVGGIVLNSRDVTEQRALETQLRSAQKMEAVGRLAGGMAHDFNNLLTAIRGHAEFLRETVDGDAGDDVREILKNSTRAADLIRQLLAFARQQVLRPRVVDLREVLHGAETLLRRLIGEDLDLTMDAGGRILPVEADLNQLEQVLMNLAVNARDAMPTGGALSIRLDDVTLSAEEAAGFPFEMAAGRYVRMIVQDTGEGIESDVLDQVFEPFFTTKQPGRGTGLGLSTVYGIVKQSGGYIHVESEPDLGTTFQVFLPRADEAPVAARGDDPAPTDAATGPAAAAGATDPSAGKVVLLVEDEDAVRTISRRVLERAGFHVIEAASPVDAVTRIVPERGCELDLLVTDVVMPDMGGRELANRVEAHCPGIRVVYMSGYTGSEMIQRGVFDDGAPFLEKPFSPAELVRVVREVFVE